MNGRARRGRVPVPPAGPLAVAGVCALLVAAPWLVDDYTLHTAARMAAVGLLAVSVAVLTGQAGLPTLGQVAPYAVGAYTAGLLAKAGHTTGVLQLVAAAGAAALFSAVVGVGVVRARGVVFLMVTLAVGELTSVAADQWRGVTGGTDGLTGVPAATLWPGGPALVASRDVYWYALAVTALAVLVVWLLVRSPFGLRVRGVRDAETRMRASGHRVGVVLLLTYTAAGTLAGVAGALLVSVQRYVSPADVGFQVSALVLLAVVIGGAHSVAGALVGAALVVWVRDWAAATVPGHGPLLLGLVFVAAVYLLPRGAAGALSDAAGRLAGWLDRRVARPTAPAGPAGPVGRRDGREG